MKNPPGYSFWKKAGRMHWFALSIFLCSAVARGQQKDLHFINFTNREGLSTNSINAICKDKYGYMWFATQDGLNKFNGTDFVIYRHNPADSTSLGGNDINSLYQDKKGNIWIGTNQSLSVYNPDKDAFTNYHFMGNSAIRAICQDHAGNLWAGGYSGLYRLDPAGKVERYGAGTNHTERLFSNTILSLYEDRQQRLWIGTNAGLDLYMSGHDRLSGYLHSDTDTNSIADNIVRAITEDSTGTVWFGTNKGLSALPRGANSFKNYTKSAADPGLLLCNRIYALRTDRSGRLWIGTEEGLNIFDPRSGSSKGLVSDQRNKYSLVGNSVRALFIDSNGLYWIGVYQGGVSKYDENLAFFNFQGSNAFDPAGLTAPIVTSFVESPSGDIYVGTDGGGLNLFHRRTGLFDHPALTGRQKLTILAMERSGNDLWIATYNHGLYQLDMISGKVRHFMQGKGPGDLSGNDLFCLKKDRKGNLWIGTNGNGVDVLPAGSDRFEHPGRSTVNQDGGIMAKGFIRAIEEDKAGNIWIASTGGGIVVYDPASKSAKVLDHDNSQLPSNVVLSLHADGNGNMWAGSMAGLSVFSSSHRQFTSFSEQDGLSNAVIYKILEDSSGKLWVSTNKGISSFDKDSRHFKNYSYHNGIQRSTFSLGAGLRTASGEMFFGGLEGFNYFDPLTLNSFKSIPSLQFTALKIANGTVIPGPDQPIRDNISEAREIRLDYKQNFSIDFIALNYTTPQDCNYAYRLEGFDKDWNRVGNAHTAIYTNLDPGEYTFRARATSDDGSWRTNDKAIRIIVRPPFWRTGFAYAIFIFVAVMLVLLLRFIGIRRLKNKFALEQERKEAERQHEFDELKIKFLTNLSHEFRTPVSLIVGPIDQLLSQEESGEKKGQLSMVKRNANRILNLVNQFLDLKKLEHNELNLQLSEGDMISFIRDIADSFKDIAHAKQIDFRFVTTINQYYTKFDRDKLDRVLLNLLSNAFKFTDKEGCIRLNVDRPDGSDLIKISVSDTGIGMSKEVLDKIFTRFFQAGENKNVLNQGSGIGLSIAKEFVKLHGGHISVESVAGKGTVFTVSLPCPPVPAPVSESATITPPPIEVPAPGLSHEKYPFQNVTVLLVEDDDELRHYLKESLKPYYRVVEASNGKEGWQRALSSHPYVIVSDINMPYMDGITLSRKIKSDKRTSHIPILLLTAITGDLQQLKGLQTGASDYLTKPFNFEILNIKIRNLILLNQNLKNTYSRQLKVTAAGIETAPEDEKILAKVTQYIESHLDSLDLSVEDLSKHLCMSRGSLYNKIVDLTGETPVEFIRSLKLQKGAWLLENSDMKIAQIGYAVGFSSPNYFAKAFKAKFNVSPSEYAQQKRGLEGHENERTQSA